jgi:hypothetical protein
MSLTRILAAAFIGTSAMTLTSYGVSKVKNQQFREPELLAALLKRIFSNVKKEDAHRAGWLIHYGVGLLFCTVYDRIWSTTEIKPTLLNAVLLGGICGAGGATVWKFVFALHPHPPENDRKKFYPHLLVAHIIFGAGAAIGYRLPEKIKSSGRIHPPEDGQLSN